MEFYTVCPCCNKQLKIVFKEDAFTIEGVSFDNKPEEVAKKLAEAGYEFGQEGGE